MNVFYFWELFCQNLMLVSISEVELNRLLTPDSVHMSWFLLNWMCLTNPFKIWVLYLFLFRTPGLDKDTWWLWTMNFSSNGEISVLCHRSTSKYILPYRFTLFLVVVLQIEWSNASSNTCFLVFILQTSEVRKNSRNFFIPNTFYHLWDPFNLWTTMTNFAKLWNWMKQKQLFTW